MSAIVLFSGGVDSTVAAVRAVIDGHQVIKLLHVEYGSLHQEAETRATQKVTKALIEMFSGILWCTQDVTMPQDLFAGGHSSLMGDLPIPNKKYQVLETEGPSSTVVPFRNANLISVATTIAERDEYQAVYIAVHASDHNRWAYPDCSPEFIGAMANAVYVGTMHKVRLVAPFVWMTKTDVVRFGHKYRVPFEITWSCYRGGEIHCGECPTCLERQTALSQGLGVDPTLYLKFPEGYYEHLATD